MENNEEVAFNIILHAGEAKNHFLLAMKSARMGDFEESENSFKAGSKELQLAHQVQTDLLIKEAQGENMTVTVLTVHAQDHLSNAIFLKDIVNEYTEGFKVILNQKEK